MRVKAGEVHPSREHLARLFWLRNIAIVAEILGVAAAVGLLGLQLPLLPVGLAILGWGLFNAFVGRRLARTRRVQLRELRLQLVVDVVQITVVLALTGGAANPFVSIYLIPIAVSAAILPRRDTWVFAGIAVAAYAFLLLGFDGVGHGDHDAVARSFHLHVIGMWVHFVLAAALVAGFVAGMSATVRRQQRMLAEARERALRDEQLVRLGALAASAAHEMGTPLGTMALMLDEVEDAADVTTRREVVEVLRRQIERCREALGNLSAAAGEVRVDDGDPMAADRFLEGFLARWREGHPDAEVDVRCSGRGEPPRVLAERTLEHALGNLLDNAVRAGGGRVEVVLEWQGDQVWIGIQDRGPGLAGFGGMEPGHGPAPEGSGLGLGLFLSRAIIERLGGRLRLQDRPGGGLITRVELPVV